jgi:hypothetical protein
MSVYEDSMTLYGMAHPNEIPDLQDLLDELADATDIRVSVHDESAVVGELAGRALEILLSPPMDAIVRLTEVGAIVLAIVKRARTYGRSLRIGRKVASVLAASTASDAHPDRVAKPNVWSLEIEPKGELWQCCYDVWDGAASPMAYLVRVTVPLPQDCSADEWFVLAAGGKVCAAWTAYTDEDPFV